MKVAEVISTENTCYVYRWNKLTDADITRFIKYWRMCSGIEFNIPAKKVAAVVNALRCSRVIKGKQMKCREIDEAFAIFELRDDTYRGTDGKLKPIPEPVPDDKLQKAVENTRRKKIRQMATVIQANKLNAARTQVTADDRLMAFHLANS